MFVFFLSIYFLPLPGLAQEDLLQEDHQALGQRVDFSPDLSLVKPLSRENHQAFGHRMPCFAHYRKGERELVFLGTRHGTALGSSSHLLIQQVIKGFMPDCLVVEGFPRELGPSPRRVLRDAQHQRARGVCPEPLFAVALAADRKIVFFGGEPSPMVTAKALLRVGSERDALGWLVVRELGQIRREEGLGRLDGKLKRLLLGLKNRFQFETQMDINDFKKWYLDRAGHPLDKDRLSATQTAPLAGPNASFFEKMAIEVMLAREKHLVTLQARLLADYQRVLVVYGGGHLIYQQAVLDEMLGPPVGIHSSWPSRKKKGPGKPAP